MDLIKQIENLKIKYLKNPVITVQLYNEILDLLLKIDGGSTTIIDNTKPNNGGKQLTAIQIRDLLQTLIDENRLDASAIKNLSENIFVVDKEENTYTIQEMVFHLIDMINERDTDVPNEPILGDGNKFLNDQGQYVSITWENIINRITKTSQLKNDGNGTSEFITVAETDLLFKNVMRLDTSILSGLELTKISQTSFAIKSGSFLSKNYTDNKSEIVSVPNDTIGYVHSFDNTKKIAFIGMDINKNLVVRYEPFNLEDSRTILTIGMIEYDASQILSLSNQRINNRSTLLQLHDLMKAVGVINMSGNKVVPIGGRKFSKQQGTFFGSGLGGLDSFKPNTLNSIESQIKYRVVNLNGSFGSEQIDFDFSKFNKNGVISELTDGNYGFVKLTFTYAQKWFYEYGDVDVPMMDLVLSKLSKFESHANVKKLSMYTIFVTFKKNIVNNVQALQDGDLLIIVGGTSGTSVQNITKQDVINALEYVPEDIENKKTNLENPNDTTYPTTKAVVDEFDIVNDRVDNLEDLINNSTIRYDFINQSHLEITHNFGVHDEIRAFVYVNGGEIICDIKYYNDTRLVNINFSEPLTGHVVIKRLN